MFVKGHATCLWFVVSLFGLNDLPGGSDPLGIGCEVLYGAVVVTILWSYAITWGMTWRFLYLFLLSDA